MNIIELKNKISKEIEYEKARCKEVKDEPYFCGVNVGRYEAYEKVLNMINDVNKDYNYENRY